MLCLFSLILQIVIFYEPDSPVDLLLNCISILTSACIGVQLFYLDRRRSNLIETILRSVLVLIHPNVFMEEVNCYLHLVMPIRILVVLEYLFKRTVLNTARAHRVLEICGLEGEGVFEFTLKVCLNEFTPITIVMLYVLAITFFSHLMVIASACSPHTPYSFETSF